jgi:hypothetical protein
VLETALPLLATALETLANTNDQQVARQFRERLPQMAGDVGVEGITGLLCRELYNARSEPSHGASVKLLSPRKGEGETAPTRPPAEALAKVKQLQDLLRATIRKAHEEPDFAATFESVESIRAGWPVVITS